MPITALAVSARQGAASSLSAQKWPRHLCPRWEFRRPVRGCAQRGGSRDPADMGGDGGVIGLDPNGEVVDLGIFQ